MEICIKSKYLIKTITYILLGSLLPSISIANTSEKNSPDEKKIELIEIEVKDNVARTYLKKRISSATKTDTRIRDIPQSISVITEEQIKDQSLLGLTDAIKYSPGVMAGQGEGNRDSVWFRGNQSTSDLFVDSVRDDVQYYRDLYNIDRVEVLMGPNGMIFGRGGVGGVINRVTKEAHWENKNELRMQGGTYDHKRSSIDLNSGINETLAVRINAMIEDSGSFRQGVESEKKAINPTFTFKPSDKTKIVVGMEYFNDKRTNDRGIPSVSNGLQSRPFSTSRSTFFGNASQSPNEAIVKNGYAIIDHTFDNGMSVKNTTRFSDYDKYYQNVYANSSVQANGTFTIDGYYDNTQRQNFFNQTDLTYNFKTGSVSHKLLTGLEIGLQENQNYRIVNSGTDPTPLASNPFALLTFNSSRSRNTSTDISNQAIYLQDQIYLNEQFQIIAGLRYDKFKTKFNDSVTIANSATINDQFISPRVGLVYKPIEPVSLYTNYSLSYLPRTGEQLTSLTSSIKSFDPEKFTNIEAGIKYDLLQSFSISSSIYRLERSKMAITDPSSPTNTIIVDGQVTKGFELGVAGKLFDSYSMYGGYTYQDAEITKNQGTGDAQITSGTPLGHVPKHTFSLWNKYEMNETWSAALGVISRSDMFAATPTTSTAVKLPGYARLDAAIYANINKQTKLQLNIENLLDKTYYQSAHNNNNIMYGYPLTARATLTYTF
ncbi:TonB-dependent receptor [Candidatus Methylopumilus planktonicus]|uniref:TonB-dependent receptor n=1 Tax=Candidatus Methylopumilus planktonicus TaxID=1581557 RepID=UPI001121F5B2|nr:TonB-dependent siderophore receptor [Candidatus Methylopumilus planktonicus]QDD10733.1 TonB-dependent siderophore receptor [Candidatus Methylopumilus planktonicus]QDD23202.1 TonB-dependent siderophore receptor [Candidatus Methylopumilus planktonicus]